MNVETELGLNDLEQRLVGRLTTAYTLLQTAPYTRETDFCAGDMAVYVVKDAKKNGKLHKVQRAMGL